MVAANQFRADLFYRLNAFPLHLPPLRERREDIAALVEYFVQYYARMLKRDVVSVSPETMAALCRYCWPGNIRELQNVIERAVLLSTGPTLIGTLPKMDPPEAGPAPASGDGADELERRRILAALEASGWVLAGEHGAAARLGLRRSTLQFRMKKLGLVRPAARRTG
jgi:formate hydrogenlyase transcriptional activator